MGKARPGIEWQNHFLLGGRRVSLRQADAAEHELGWSGAQFFVLNSLLGSFVQFFFAGGLAGS
jgi:hypothetical protein